MPCGSNAGGTFNGSASSSDSSYQNEKRSRAGLPDRHHEYVYHVLGVLILSLLRIHNLMFLVTLYLVFKKATPKNPDICQPNPRGQIRRHSPHLVFLQFGWREVPVLHLQRDSQRSRISGQQHSKAQKKKDTLLGNYSSPVSSQKVIYIYIYLFFESGFTKT